LREKICVCFSYFISKDLIALKILDDKFLCVCVCVHAYTYTHSGSSCASGSFVYAV